MVALSILNVFFSSEKVDDSHSVGWIQTLLDFTGSQTWPGKFGGKRLESNRPRFLVDLVRNLAGDISGSRHIVSYIWFIWCMMYLFICLIHTDTLSSKTQGVSPISASTLAHLGGETLQHPPADWKTWWLIYRYKSSYIESAKDLQIGVLFLAIYAWILLKQYPCLLIDQVWIPNFNICFPGRWKSSPSVTIAGCRVLSLVFVLTPEADT